MGLPGATIPVDAVRHWIGDATSRLLGDTIGMSEAEWHQPSLLPGWSRAHVATHVARGADKLNAVALHPERGLDHDHPDARFFALERGADRPGIDLQLDLDQSASAMHRSWNDIADWDAPVQIFGKSCKLSSLALFRLHEVCIHHIDLGMGGSADAIDREASVWLLRWVLGRVTCPAGRAMTITAASGTVATIGSGRVHRKVSGSDARLWAWLSGRADPASVDGARGMTLGLLA